MSSDQFYLDNSGMYRCRSLDQFAWLAHGFGTQQVSPPVDVTLRQIHSALVVKADGLQDREQEGDALVTSEPGVVIGVRTADCVPILLIDSRQRIVAAIHAGWRGTEASIATQTIRFLNAHYGSNAGDIWAAIGPCIRRAAYQVSWDVARRFTSWLPDLHPDEGGKCLLDLPGVNTQQMLDAGIPRVRIADSELCTHSNASRFFSYRRDPANPGRLISAICRLV